VPRDPKRRVLESRPSLVLVSLPNTLRRVIGRLPWAISVLIVVNLWGVGNAMIIDLAGLQDIPVEQYKASAIDRASSWRRLMNITIPPHPDFSVRSLHGAD
jgi:ABC-type sugar transport system permease subunit